MNRPASDRPQDLGFVRQPMVEWLAPGELAKAAMRVILSGVFGAYADKRELQGVGPIGDVLDYSHLDEMWIDYVADVADGFDATMTVASSLARAGLNLANPGHDTSYPTRRGDVLVMGGDQVYPTADYANYRNRLIGPYRAALPAVEGPHPHLYAIPGNHDWYDGLTAFLRVFCQGERIGAWETRQRRSYFAMQLPHRWWLWGIDTQLESYLDPSQVSYFRDVMGPQLQPGDSLILCSATPSWLDANVKDPNAYENIDYLEREVINPRGASIRLKIAGDKHHYARYDEVGGDRQAVTSGGGGAYLAATHRLPQRIHVPPVESTDLEKSPPTDYQLQTRYPPAAVSRKLRFGVWRLPWQNGSFWGLLTAAYLVVGWSVLFGLRPRGVTFDTLLRNLSFQDLVSGLFLRPLGLLMGVGLILALVAFTRSPVGWKRWLLGTSHAIGHFLLILATIWGAASILDGLDDPWLSIGVTVILGVVGGLLGSWLVALYLLTAELFDCNVNELFAAQHIEGYNNFVRAHISNDGTLTLYPVRIRKVARWDFQPEGDQTTPWFSPRGAPPEPALIEAPITIPPTPIPEGR